MTWHYQILGNHVHVQVFYNGANCGSLCFRREEFDQIVFLEETNTASIQVFIPQTPQPTTHHAH